MEKKIGNFIGNESLSKTMRFKLNPVGKTEENFIKSRLLEDDESRAKAYEMVKNIIDGYHKVFIDSVLSRTELVGLEQYYELYQKKSKGEAENKAFALFEEKLRKQIAKAFSSDSIFSKLFKADMIEEILPGFVEDGDELDAVHQFKGFATYFMGFHENRRNMYTDKADAGGIANRLINQNLPKYVDNINTYVKVKEKISAELNHLDEELDGVMPVNMMIFFEIRGFNHVLTQEGIDFYNEVIGGMSFSDGTKIKGINEYINLYNQKKSKNERLPLLKPLFKQILSDRDSISFIPETFEKDQEVLDALAKFFSEDQEEGVLSAVKKCESIFEDLAQYDLNKVWLKAGTAVTDLSNGAFGDWKYIEAQWKNKYDLENPPKKNLEKHEEKKAKAYKAIDSFSLWMLGELAENDEAITTYYNTIVGKCCEAVYESYERAKDLISNEYCDSKKLAKNDNSIELIKGLLDSVKKLEKVIKPFNGTGKEENKDEMFYGIFSSCYEVISSIDRLYDKVRNYITKKPYSTDKIKLNFENPQFLNGWDKNKERDYRTLLLKKNDMFYLAIMDKKNNRAFVEYPYEDGEEYYEKMEYKLLPGPNKMLPKVFFAKSNIDYFMPSKEILSIYANGTFKKGDNFSLSDCHQLIDFYKKSLDRHEEWRNYDFQFKPTEEYDDIGEFYKDVKDQGYRLQFNRVSKEYVDFLVEKGELYVFQIYNKDFSPNSTGTPNLHTMYFKMLFDERNLKDVVFKLNGEAEMFYRKASIMPDEMIVHPAGQVVQNKNKNNPSKLHEFKFDVIKDRRYTKNQFMLHLPITINFKAGGGFKLNSEVRKAIKECENNYIIGIDRGERNLLYLSVIDEDGNIVEQHSLNEICNSHNEYESKTNYHDLLIEKEKEREVARQSWKSINSIKELKEGYLSQVIKKICDLVVKYDAIIAMEDLNTGFKNSRAKVERQVYQKFEKMLVDKLNYLADKKINPENSGGILNGYQLTNKPDGYATTRQDGFIFYVPAWLTSKIDPSTGFVNLLYPKYTNVDEARKFFERMDDIRFNPVEDMFEFDIDYSKYPKADISHVKKWTICSNGERIEIARRKEANNQFASKSIVLTEEYKGLFSAYGIEFNSNLKESILDRTEKDFFLKLIKLFALTLQMRNSEPNNTAVDYIISPVRNKDGEFYCSDNADMSLPQDADANGAYNIARKALWIVKKIKAASDEELEKLNLSITNKEWLELAQNNDR